MPLPATEINKELCEWAHANLLKIPKEEDRDYYDKKISGVLIKPHERSHLEELIIKQRARDYYDMKMQDFATPEDFVREREKRVAELLGRTNGRAYLEPPVYFNFGYNVSVGKNFYANFNCTFLDWSVIRIGDNVAIGPNCTLTTVNHPLDCDERSDGLYSYPIIIENGVWIGAGCMILSGVTIGEGSVVAAGSVVTRDVPAHVVVAGSPARVKAHSRRHTKSSTVPLASSEETSGAASDAESRKRSSEDASDSTVRGDAGAADAGTADAGTADADADAQPDAKRRKQ